MHENSIDENKGDAYIRVYADTWLELEIITLPLTLSRPLTGLPVCSYYRGKYGNEGEEYSAMDTKTIFFATGFGICAIFMVVGRDFADTKPVTVGAYQNPPPR